MTSIAIMIGTPTGSKLLAAASERQAALSAERIILRCPRAALPVPLWVQCADPAISARLTTYLGGLQAELIGVPAA
ncbi:hypothetical protein MKK70_11795 [Methylobacterium sp. E-041]|jgi:hypothetical protein|uniref:hypothetical protein n=1 Tax=unclassified Methylobacterium TaxID=2615210 RepID=UPI0011CCDEF5|nr:MULTISPECIES: hypothetical protein [unclassified Methylobacterium]RZK86644.1 MAG: hypothetical protein EOO66_21665 [Methylobacterium sp.]MCJ2008245.1 hypothetical protein [Methylobacterium sp. J-092]MCJ2042175.1 hypothetical protein [Methylobacterium sp. J-059]MCJ2075316.1 hypothetical protein [Methylobacterium sp. E-016]MCJ2106045.1 hypothetical protein [Methylobacterium sp. E-041]